MRSILLLTFALVAAGCVGASDAPLETASADVASPGNATAAPIVETTSEDPAIPVAVPVSYSGSTPEGVCSAAGCQWLSEGAEDYHPIEHTGHATKLAVQVTYADVKPGMEFYIGICIGDGADETQVTCRDYTTGPSPLVVEFDLADHVPGQGIALSTGALNGLSTMSGLMVFSSSSFQVEGTLTVMPSTMH